MGLMIEGVYYPEDPLPNSDDDGTFKRAATTIRNWISADGPFTPDRNRYHLYVAWNCPWAHRTLLARAILQLADVISVAYARPRRTELGWVYDAKGAFSDPILGILSLPEVYALQNPKFTGRLTVPVLWDKKTNQIVSNESTDIIRMLAKFGQGSTLYPEQHRREIDVWNEHIYANVNNGVYRAGFARTQQAYDKAVVEVFAALDKIEAHLGENPWLVGDDFSEADLRLFPTLARFDVAYNTAFKCNLRRLTDYPNLWEYARRIFAISGVAETVNFEIYKQGYFSPSALRNPLGIVPAGPIVDWSL